MKTPFLLVRFIFFSILVYLNVTALVLAAWSIGSVKAAHMFVPGGSVFLIVNACFLFVGVTLAFVGHAWRNTAPLTTMVAFECGWTGVMSVLALAASIDVTLSGPPVFCQPNVPFSVCASVTILVPVSWLAGITMLTYFLAILGLSVGHMHEHPGLWSRSIYTVPWFEDHSVSKYPPRLPPIDTAASTRLSVLSRRLSRRHSLSSFPEDVEENPRTPSVAAGTTPVSAGNAEKPLPPIRPDSGSDTSRPWWARVGSRRAMDLPFPVRFHGFRDGASIKSKRKGKAVVTPTYDDDVVPENFPDDYTGSRTFPFLEKRRPGQAPLPPYPKITREMLDPNHPVPLPPLSEWVRADEARGINLRTMQRSGDESAQYDWYPPERV
ncbi:hypothetical protein OF83DRAFT_920934 [Amylostereum chailletii]|nr:hypothetical protein OF83DRAFT_920934 [Amylostereum chailletii]